MNFALDHLRIYENRIDEVKSFNPQKIIDDFCDSWHFNLSEDRETITKNIREYCTIDGKYLQEYLTIEHIYLNKIYPCGFENGHIKTIRTIDIIEQDHMNTVMEKLNNTFLNVLKDLGYIYPFEYEGQIGQTAGGIMYTFTVYYTDLFESIKIPSLFKSYGYSDKFIDIYSNLLSRVDKSMKKNFIKNVINILETKDNKVVNKLAQHITDFIWSSEEQTKIIIDELCGGSGIIEQGGFHEFKKTVQELTLEILKIDQAEFASLVSGENNDKIEEEVQKEVQEEIQEDTQKTLLQILEDGFEDVKKLPMNGVIIFITTDYLDRYLLEFVEYDGEGELKLHIKQLVQDCAAELIDNFNEKRKKKVYYDILFFSLVATIIAFKTITAHDWANEVPLIELIQRIHEDIIDKDSRYPYQLRQKMLKESVDKIVQEIKQIEFEILEKSYWKSCRAVLQREYNDPILEDIKKKKKKNMCIIS